MSYRELDTVPAYEQFVGVSPKEGEILWGSKDAPPPIGASIVVTINGCGPAVVTGYFVEHGFLGVRCRLLDPPEWHRKQNKGNPNGHVFGPEFRMADA